LIFFAGIPAYTPVSSMFLLTKLIAPTAISFPICIPPAIFEPAPI